MPYRAPFLAAAVLLSACAGDIAPGSPSGTDAAARVDRADARDAGRDPGAGPSSDGGASLPGAAGLDGRPADDPAAPGRAYPGDDTPGGGTPIACASTAAPGAMPSRVIRLSYTQYNRTLTSLFAPLPKPAKQDPRGSSAPTVPEFAMPFENPVDSERVRSLDFALTLNAAESEAVLEAGEVLAAGLQERLEIKTPCLKTWDDRTCMAEAFRLTGRALFRRPLTEAEVDALLALHDEGRRFLTPREAGKVVLTGMFASPKFLFRTEIGDASGALTPFELSDALGYGLTDGPPDAQLVDAAAAGTLVQKDELRRQIDRLFAEKQVSARMISFARDLLSYDAYEVRDKPITDHTVANFGVRGRASTKASSDQFVSAVFEESPLRVPTRLMTSTRTFVSGPNDELFGKFDTIPYKDGSKPCPPVAGSTMVHDTGSTCWYEFEGKPLGRTGLLTQPAFLGAFATAKGNEFVRRGRFVRERLLCAPVPQAPADLADEIAMGMAASETLAGTARDRFKVHSDSAKCSGCHTLIDPFAIPLEGYDFYGRTRKTESVQGKSLPIDTRTALLLDDGKPPVPVNDAMEMSEKIAASADYQRCFLARLYGVMVARENGCRAREAIAHYQKNGEDLTAFAKWIYTDDRFLHRKR